MLRYIGWNEYQADNCSKTQTMNETFGYNGLNCTLGICRPHGLLLTEITLALFVRLAG